MLLHASYIGIVSGPGQLALKLVLFAVPLAAQVLSETMANMLESVFPPAAEGGKGTADSMIQLCRKMDRSTPSHFTLYAGTHKGNSAPGVYRLMDIMNGRTEKFFRWPRTAAWVDDHKVPLSPAGVLFSCQISSNS